MVLGVKMSLWIMTPSLNGSETGKLILHQICVRAYSNDPLMQDLLLMVMYIASLKSDKEPSFVPFPNCRGLFCHGTMSVEDSSHSFAQQAGMACL